MLLNQVAFYAETIEESDRIKDLFGLRNETWIKDTVTARSSVYGSGWETNVAELEFNYSMQIELEILRYIKGPSWHDVDRNLNRNSFISHIGIHLEDGEDFPPMPGCMLVQETITDNHTSEYLVKNGRTYHYKIFKLTQGSYIKYIKRIEVSF